MPTIKFTIPIAPVTKKNHSQILINKKTGRPFIAPSPQYKKYERYVAGEIQGLGLPYDINKPCNVKAIYYMPTRRRVDLVNLHSALHDVLVHCRILEDDNSKIIASTDGSRVMHDKDNPRTEVEITWED